MRLGATLSALMHLVLLALMIFGLPNYFEVREPAEQTVVVELVQVAEKTTPPPKPEPKPVEEAEPEPPPPPPLPPEPKPEVVETPPPPPAPEVKPEPPPPPPPERKLALVEPRPELAPLPKPEPPKPPEPEPAPKVVEQPPPPKPEPPKPPEPEPVAQAPPPPPKPRAKPRPKPEPKKADFDLDRVAALLDKKVKSAPSTPPREERPPEKPSQSVAVRPTASRLSTEPLTISEIDAIRVQIQRCWSLPTGAPDPAQQVVRIRIRLNPDGTLVAPPEIVDQARMNQPDQGYFRVAAEAARRAVQKCQPLQHLPVAKYDSWREIELTFDPREMMG